MGPVFVAGDMLGVPPWLAQRMWSAVVLLRRLRGGAARSRRAGRGSAPGAGLVAGAGLRARPAMLSDSSGGLSGEALPAAVLPWVLLPLVHAVAGRYSAARAAGLSGLAVLCVGGVNADGDAWRCCPCRRSSSCAGAAGFAAGGWPRGGRRRVGAASAWWVRARCWSSVAGACRSWTSSRPRGPPLAHSGWSNVARGLDHWLFFAVVDGRPWWTGAASCADEPRAGGRDGGARGAGLRRPAPPAGAGSASPSRPALLPRRGAAWCSVTTACSRARCRGVVRDLLDGGAGAAAQRAQARPGGAAAARPRPRPPRRSARGRAPDPIPAPRGPPTAPARGARRGGRRRGPPRGQRLAAADR